MYPRTNYEMTQDDLDSLLDSMKSEPVIMLNIIGGRSKQDRANDAWKRLGEKMGFDHMTVQPTGKGDRFFSAIPSETEQHRQDRLSREKEESLRKSIKQTEDDIKFLQEKLSKLLDSK